MLMMKQILSSLLLGATLCIGGSSLATASSSLMVGPVEYIKEQDSASGALRVKAVITDAVNVFKARAKFQNPDFIAELKPRLEAGDVTYQDLGRSVHVTILRSLFDRHLPELRRFFGNDVAKYLPEYDRAPASAVLFDTPRAFNPYLYGLYNPDVQAAYNPAKDGAYENFMRAHFFNFRVRENRSYKLPDDFSSANYLKLNPDVASAAYTDADPNFFAISHYVQHGRGEKRAYAPTLPADFDANEYFALNPDVAKNAPVREFIGGKDAEFAKEHYLKHGFAEGRAYKADVPADFSTWGYLLKNQDVAQHVRDRGVDFFAQDAYARAHYMHHGQHEKRLYR
jgi:hypothetical protein